MQNVGFNGKNYDNKTALYDYGFRHYNALTGRWNRLDPIRDGVNWYVYCGNDPVNYVDWLGLEGEKNSHTGIDVNSLEPGIYRMGRLREDLVRKAKNKKKDYSNWNPGFFTKRHSYLLVKDMNGNTATYSFFPKKEVKLHKFTKGLILKNVNRDTNLTATNELKPYIIEKYKFKNKDEVNIAFSTIGKDMKNTPDYHPLFRNCQTWAKKTFGKIVKKVDCERANK